MSLSKVLQNKYGEFSRQFSSEDGQVFIISWILLRQEVNTNLCAGPSYRGNPPGESLHIRPVVRGQCGGQPGHSAPGPPAPAQLQAEGGDGSVTPGFVGGIRRGLRLPCLEPFTLIEMEDLLICCCRM